MVWIQRDSKESKGKVIKLVRTPMNTAKHQKPNADLGLREKDLPDSQERQRRVLDLWYVQVDAAARDEAEIQGRRRRQCLSSSGSRGGRRCEEARGKMEGPPGLIYKGKGINGRRENQGA